MLTALVLAAATASAPALTPSIALEHARAMVTEAMGSNGQARFRKTGLKVAAPNMVFCGQVNVVYDNGPTGWKDVMIVVSGNPNLKAVVIDHGQIQRDLIRSVCGRGEPTDKRDYSAALSVW